LSAGPGKPRRNLRPRFEGSRFKAAVAFILGVVVCTSYWRAALS